MSTFGRYTEWTTDISQLLIESQAKDNCIEVPLRLFLRNQIGPDRAEENSSVIIFSELGDWSFVLALSARFKDSLSISFPICAEHPFPFSSVRIQQLLKDTGTCVLYLYM
jgi:hypothetical protein